MGCVQSNDINLIRSKYIEKEQINLGKFDASNIGTRKWVIVEIIKYSYEEIEEIKYLIKKCNGRPEENVEIWSSTEIKFEEIKDAICLKSPTSRPYKFAPLHSYVLPSIPLESMPKSVAMYNSIIYMTMRRQSNSLRTYNTMTRTWGEISVPSDESDTTYLSIDTVNGKLYEMTSYNGSVKGIGLRIYDLEANEWIFSAQSWAWRRQIEGFSSAYKLSVPEKDLNELLQHTVFYGCTSGGNTGGNNISIKVSSNFGDKPGLISLQLSSMTII